MTQVILPELGEGITKATISYWYFKIGDKVEGGQDLVEMATDKAVFNVPSPVSGVLKEIYFNEAEVVEVGKVLAEIEEQ
ncbi:MAG: biotin/lipoyl-containing protein [Candidatus Omnitrophota bacterium]